MWSITGQMFLGTLFITYPPYAPILIVLQVSGYCYTFRQCSTVLEMFRYFPFPNLQYWGGQLILINSGLSN